MDNTILDKKINDISLREMEYIQFMNWMGKKVNDSGIGNTLTTELNMLLAQHSGTRTMTDMNKMEIINKMVRAGISI